MGLLHLVQLRAQLAARLLLTTPDNRSTWLNFTTGSRYRATDTLGHRLPHLPRYSQRMPPQPKMQMPITTSTPCHHVMTTARA